MTKDQAYDRRSFDRGEEVLSAALSGNRTEWTIPSERSGDFLTPFPLVAPVGRDGPHYTVETSVPGRSLTLWAETAHTTDGGNSLARQLGDVPFTKEKRFCG